MGFEAIHLHKVEALLGSIPQLTNTTVGPIPQPSPEATGLPQPLPQPLPLPYESSDLQFHLRQELKTFRHSLLADMGSELRKQTPGFTPSSSRIHRQLPQALPSVPPRPMIPSREATCSSDVCSPQVTPRGAKPATAKGGFESRCPPKEQKATHVTGPQHLLELSVVQERLAALENLYSNSAAMPTTPSPNDLVLGFEPLHKDLILNGNSILSLGPQTPRMAETLGIPSLEGKLCARPVLDAGSEETRPQRGHVKVDEVSADSASKEAGKSDQSAPSLRKRIRGMLYGKSDGKKSGAK